MVDLNLFNNDDLATIDQFGGPSGKTKLAYKALSMCNGVIFYSTESADRLLPAIAGSFPELNLKSAKHAGSGCITSTITGDSSLNGTTIFFFLYDGSQGSALACLIDNDDLAQSLINRLQLPPQGMKDHAGIVVREAAVVSSRTRTGAAAAIGRGSVVAPWYVPGFEGTHEPDSDDASDGYITGVMPANLVHALSSWQQIGFCVYQKAYTHADGKHVSNILAAGFFEHEAPGPKLALSLGRMTAQELSLLWGGIEKFGPCHTQLRDGNGVLICDLDPHATSDQVDARAHELLATVDRWIDKGIRHGELSSTNQAPTAQSPAQGDSDASASNQRLHDALKARLDATLGHASAEQHAPEDHTPADAPSSPAPVPARPDLPPIPSPSPVSATTPTTPFIPSAPAVASAPTVPTTPQPDARFCTNCGTRLPAGAKFCGRCGIKLG